MTTTRTTSTAHRRPGQARIPLTARGVVIVPVDDAAVLHEAIVRSRPFGRALRAVHVFAPGEDHAGFRRRWRTRHPLIDLVELERPVGAGVIETLVDWIDVESRIDDVLVVIADDDGRLLHAIPVGRGRDLERALTRRTGALVARVHCASLHEPPDRYLSEGTATPGR